MIYFTSLLVLLSIASGCGRPEERAQTSAKPITSPASTEIVATSDVGSVTRRQIRCGSSAPQEKCLAIEQENLRVRLSRLIIDAAVKTYAVELTDDERLQVDATVAAQRSGIDQAARTFRAAISGAARVHDGEPLDRVAKDVGVSTRYIEQAASEYWTATEARAALARDLRQEIEASTRKAVIRTIIEPKLRKLIRDRATKDGVTEAAAAATFWDEIRIRQHFRVVDARYKLPDFSGVLNVNEITINNNH